jgi:hypothetical protein
MVARNSLPVELICQALIYKDGSLYWRTDRPKEHFVDERAWKHFNTNFAGEEAGYPHFQQCQNRWRWMVKLSGEDISRSVIVWAIHHDWPTQEVDHIDRNTLNDRIENLRLATRSQGNANRTKHSNNKSGYKGVCWDNRAGRWRAKIQVKKTSIFLGRFNTREEAYAVYCQAAIKYFGEFACLE